MILERLNMELDREATIVCLQEVLPSVKEYLCKRLDERGCGFNCVYSLDHRRPGKYDTRSRQLGLLVIMTPDIELVRQGVAERAPYPDRTVVVHFSYRGKSYTLLGLHSVAGVEYKKGKSVQFDSFAEIVSDLKPDIVAVDANEPMIDHYDTVRMEFFNNGDKGAGAKRFFTSMVYNGLTDAYSLFYDKGNYVPGKPLFPSYILSSGETRRYDFLFVNNGRLHLQDCRYCYDEAIEASSDHAYIVARADMEGRIPQAMIGGADKAYTESDLLKYCRHYDSTLSDDEQTLLGKYESVWMKDMIADRETIISMVSEYIAYNLETFNLDDGVPISLKALLFNRYAHWQSYFTADGFKKWYRETYLGEDKSLS